MDSPVREMEEADEFVLVPDAADLRSYQLDEDEDDDDHEARFLAGNSEKTIDVNYFAAQPTPNVAAQRGTAAEAAAPSGGAESEGEGDDEVEDADGGLSDDDEGLGAEEVGAAEEEPAECKDGEGHHGWQQHAVGVICSVGLAAAATGLALLLGGHQQTPHRAHFPVAAGDRKAAKVSTRRDARVHQGMSVPRLEHAPAIISFGGSYDGLRF